jgi:hypothetical protein
MVIIHSVSIIHSLRHFESMSNKLVEWVVRVVGISGQEYYAAGCPSPHHGCHLLFFFVYGSERERENECLLGGRGLMERGVGV